MPKKPAKPKRKPVDRSKYLKIEGSFTDLIRKLVTTPKPKGGWGKAGK